MLYNLSEFITTIKENIGIKDLPLPVTDEQLIKHFDMVTLTDFSICYPRMEEILLGEGNIDKESMNTVNQFYTYKIPKYVYEGTTILNVSYISPVRSNDYSDFFIPGSIDAVIATIADVRMAAGVAASLAKSPTIRFIEPNKIQVFNGWSGAVYKFEILLKHDLSLATIPAGAMISLRELAELDMEAYLYNQLKRKENLEVGVGSIQLKLDEWSQAADQRKEMLREWRNEENIDFDHIIRF